MARVGRQRFAMAVAVAAIAAVPAFGTADASAASCGSSTAASSSYTDPAGDAGTQPDITNTALALDTACDIDVTFSVANRPVGLAGDDHLYLQLDTDGDTTTGQPELGVDPDYLKGADALLDISATGATLAPFAGPGQGQFSPPTAVTKTGDFGARFTLGDLATSSGTTMAGWATGCATAGLSCAGDWAADIGPGFANRTETYMLPLAFAAPTPVEPPVVPPVVPETEITKSPPNKTTSTKARLTFRADQAAASFECKLDKGAFAACSSPFKKKVGTGKHTFQVRAVLGDQTDPTPAMASWKVKKPPR